MTQANRTTPSAPLHLVIGFDFSPPALLALDEGVALAAKVVPAVIHVIGVLGHTSHSIGDNRPMHHVKYEETVAMQAQITRAVESALHRFGADGARFFVHARIGSPADEILKLASEVSADLVIVGTHGRSAVEQLLLGSVAKKVMREARCPVLVMRRKEYQSAAATTASAAVPEPACEACVAMRKETAGARWWCTQHDKPWVPPSRYGYDSGAIAPVRPNEWVLW